MAFQWDRQRDGDRQRHGNQNSGSNWMDGSEGSRSTGESLSIAEVGVLSDAAYTVFGNASSLIRSQIPEELYLPSSMQSLGRSAEKWMAIVDELEYPEGSSQALQKKIETFKTTVRNTCKERETDRGRQPTYDRRDSSNFSRRVSFGGASRVDGDHRQNHNRPSPTPIAQQGPVGSLRSQAERERIVQMVSKECSKMLDEMVTTRLQTIRSESRRDGEKLRESEKLDHTERQWELMSFCELVLLLTSEMSDKKALEDHVFWTKEGITSSTNPAQAKVLELLQIAGPKVRNAVLPGGGSNNTERTHQSEGEFRKALKEYVKESNARPPYGFQCPIAGKYYTADEHVNFHRQKRTLLTMIATREDVERRIVEDAWEDRSDQQGLRMELNRRSIKFRAEYEKGLKQIVAQTGANEALARSAPNVREKPRPVAAEGFDTRLGKRPLTWDFIGSDNVVDVDAEAAAMYPSQRRGTEALRMAIDESNYRARDAPMDGGRPSALTEPFMSPWNNARKAPVGDESDLLRSMLKRTEQVVIDNQFKNWLRDHSVNTDLVNSISVIPDSKEGPEYEGWNTVVKVIRFIRKNDAVIAKFLHQIGEKDAFDKSDNQKQGIRQYLLVILSLDAATSKDESNISKLIESFTPNKVKDRMSGLEIVNNVLSSERSFNSAFVQKVDSWDAIDKMDAEINDGNLHSWITVERNRTIEAHRKLEEIFTVNKKFDVRALANLKEMLVGDIKKQSMPSVGMPTDVFGGLHQEKIATKDSIGGEKSKRKKKPSVRAAEAGAAVAESESDDHDEPAEEERRGKGSKGGKGGKGGRGGKGGKGKGGRGG